MRPTTTHILTTIGACLALVAAAAPIRAQEASPAAFAAARYTVTQLGTLGGEFTIALKINERGQVVGGSTTAPGQEQGGPGDHAFLWEDGQMTDLGTLGGDHSRAAGINDAGQVTGASLTPDGSMHAFVWADGVMTDIGTLGGSHSLAITINNAGQVSGWSTTAPGQELFDPGTHAFLWEDGQMTDLGTLGGELSLAPGLNDAGQVVGTAATAEGPPHAFLWEDGQMTDLGAAEGFALGRGLWINDRGQVVGWVQEPVATPAAGEAAVLEQAFLWDDGEFRLLPTLGGYGCHAFGITEAGLALGECAVPGAAPEAPDMRAVVWQDGQVTDLNTLVAPGSPLLGVANGANEAGQIVAASPGSHQPHESFLLTLAG